MNGNISRVFEMGIPYKCSASDCGLLYCLRNTYYSKKIGMNLALKRPLNYDIIIISNLSNDRSKTSSKTIPPHSAM